MVVLSTQQHVESDTAVIVNRYPFHWSLSFGWRRGPLTNRSCGTKTLLEHSLPKEMIREVFCPPASLQGRAGAARLRAGEMDVLVMASNFAPSSTKKCGDIAERLCSWVESIYDKHCKRTMFLWMADAGGELGMDRNEEGRMVTTKGNVVGGIRPKEENSNSREMRKTAQESSLAVATAWHDIGSTFFADHWRSSRIDHIVVHRWLWVWCAPAERYR